MGQRSRKRVRDTGAAPATDAPSAPVAARRRRNERPGPPPAPWAPVPLSELAIALGIVAIIGGFVWGGRQGFVLTACGGLLASAGALEVAVREHFAGYKSHSSLLALAAGALTVGLLLGVVPLPGTGETQRWVALGSAIVVFFASLAWWRALFRRRSGGLTFRA